MGFRVNRYGIHMEEKKVKAIRDWTMPTTPTELWSFLELAGYYRKFVPMFVQRTHLLHDLAAKSKNEYRQTERYNDQFEDLKKALTFTPVLATLDPEADFILRTDASDTAIGGVLAQKQLFEGRMEERPLGYFSQKLHAVGTRYPAYDRELLAISANLDHWTCYVHGRKRTTIYTDHTALQHILDQNKLTSHQWHHLDKLQQHDYEVKYNPDVASVVANMLSCIAYTRTPATEASLINVVELRISASEEWLQDIRKEYRQDMVFGDILEHLQSSGIRKDITSTNTRRSC